MYKGFIYGAQEHRPNQNIINPFHITNATKDMSHAIPVNQLIQDVIGGQLGPYKEWEIKYGTYSDYTYRLFENKPFQARLKIGQWYTTAASAKVEVTWDDMSSYLYMDEFWKFLPRLIIDNTDPTSVNIYIEGKFVFISKSGAVGLKEVE